MKDAATAGRRATLLAVNFYKVTIITDFWVNKELINKNTVL